MNNKYKIITVSPSIPSSSTGGGGNWSSSLIEELSKKNFEIIHIAVIGKHSSIKIKDNDKLWLKKLGVRLEIVKFDNSLKKRNFFNKFLKFYNCRLSDFFPNEYLTSKKVLAKINKINPHCVLAFAFDAVIYTNDVKYPRMAVQAEGPHINADVILKFNPKIEIKFSIKYLIYWIKSKLYIAAYTKLFIQINKKLDISAFQGPHYVKWAKTKRLNNSIYVSTPVIDPHRIKNHIEENSETVFNILMIGHLHSTSNQSGLPLFFQELFPELLILFGENNFKINIVGNNELLPKKYLPFKKEKHLNWKGPVFPAEDEFINSDLLLVPIPAKTGSRVRIINGFSLGCCIVAHSANKLGIPELINNKNILLGDNGKELAYQIHKASKDQSLRKTLGLEGRRIYEMNYRPEVAFEKYYYLINRLIS